MFASSYNYLHDLIKLLAGGTWSAKAAKEVEEAITSVYSLSPENRRLGALLSFLDGTEAEGVAERLDPWVGQGRYAWVFDNPKDTLAMGRLSGFDVTEFLELPELRTPITSYLLYRIEPLIDGSPFALWIDEFWRLLDDAYFEDFVRDKLKTIRKKNGIVITSTQSPSDALKSDIAAALLEQTPTKIFLPNESANEADYRDGFKLTPAEWNHVPPADQEQPAVSAQAERDLGAGRLRSGRHGRGNGRAVRDREEHSHRRGHRGGARRHPAARLAGHLSPKEKATVKAPQALIAAALFTLANSGARGAGVPVVDSSNLTQALAQVEALTEQLNKMQEQLDTLKAQADTITNLYNEGRGVTRARHDDGQQRAGPARVLPRASSTTSASGLPVR